MGTTDGNLTQVESDAYDNAGAPAAPVVSETAGGSGVATTYSVRIALVDWYNRETPASDAVVYAEQNDGDLLTVASPASADGYQGYNVYVGINGKAETLQNTSYPISFGTNWTEDATSGIIAGGPVAPLSGTGDGNLTEVTAIPGAADADRVTQRLYDFRDRLIAEKDGVQASEDTSTHRPISFYQLDNAGEQTGIYRYDGDQIPLSDFANGLPAGDVGRLRAESLTSYDDQGRAYQTQQFSVDPSSGAVSANALTSKTWYDHRGNVIKTLSPGGLVQKYVYDGAGRQTVAYATDGGGDSSWADAGNITGDIVLSQVQTQYDADGNPIFTSDRERFNTDTSTQTGALGSPSSGIGARVYYSGSYYDALGRLTDSVNFGTNGGTALASRPALTSLPAGALHTSTQYTFSSTGEEDIVTDPRGIQSETFLDLLGRTTKTVAGHTTSGPASIDQTTTYTYNGDNEELTQEALNGTGHQTTQWVYGPNPTGGYTLHNNDLQVKVEMPDPNTGDASTTGSNDQTYTYDNLGEKLKTLLDENGSTHYYNYDVLGRLTFDSVPLTGTGVDVSVKSIGYTYDTNGQLSTATEYSGNTGSGTLLNQVQEVYNGLGQLIGEYQSHSGAVVIGTTPEVQYLYAGLTGSTSDGRAMGMIDPNGRQLDYVYNPGLDSNISRVSALSDHAGDGAGNIESYSYLGLDTIVQRTRPNNTDLTYIGTSNGPAGDQYTGLDEFGRVIAQNWQTTSTGTAIDRNQYGYDADSNVLYRSNLVNSAESELYHANGSSNGYDALNRLTAFSRGTLNGTNDSITSASHTISWNLDAVGNWAGTNAVVTDGAAQSRTDNARNEYTGVGSNAPTYDNNGNMTKDETGKQYVYDAWNRLKQVKDSAGNVLVTYTYDALGRRIVESPASGAATDLYFNTDSNVIEERQAGVTTAQYVWGLGYQNDLVLRDDTGGSSHHYGTTASPLNRRLFVQQDANWNVTSLADTSGAIQQRYIYDPYGAKTTLDGSWNAVVPANDTVHFIYSFQGGRQDPTSGLVHFGKPGRDYSTSLGRWTEADPSGYADGANVYQAESSDPANVTDPSGLFGIDMQYNAFIPKSLGVSAVVPTDYNWALEPGPGNFLKAAPPDTGERYYFGTDNRENAGDKGTSRIHTDAEIDSSKVGSSKDAVQFRAWADPTHEALGTDTGHGLVIFLTAIKEKTAKVSGDMTRTDPNSCSTDIEVEASGSFPFSFYSPDIVIDVIWHLTKAATGAVKVKVSGSTSKFPAYEGIVNGTVIASSKPAPGSGPALWNLGHGRPKQNVSSQTVTLGP